LIVFYNSFTKKPTSLAFEHCKPSIPGTSIARKQSAQASLLWATAIQYSAIGSIYFAALFVSLQFIVIINSNSKYTWEQYYRQFYIDYQALPTHPSRILAQSSPRMCSRFYFNQKDKRRTTAYNPQSAHSIA